VYLNVETPNRLAIGSQSDAQTAVAAVFLCRRFNFAIVAFGEFAIVVNKWEQLRGIKKKADVAKHVARQP